MRAKKAPVNNAPIKRAVQRFVELFGYELRKKGVRDIFNIRNSFFESMNHLKALNFYPDLIIDVGAADGTLPLQQSFPDASFFWIEPLKEFEPALKKLQKTYKGNYAITAVGSSSGNATLHVHNDLHGSTLYEETDGVAADGVPREIPVKTLEDIAREHDWSTFKRIMLKLDVQGFELEVLRGAQHLLDKVEVIIVEVSFFRFLKNMPDAYDVITYMKSIGYSIYDIFGGVNRPLDFALGQKDLVFVKEKGLFRNSHGWKN